MFEPLQWKLQPLLVLRCHVSANMLPTFCSVAMQAVRVLFGPPKPREIVFPGPNLHRNPYARIGVSYLPASEAARMSTPAAAVASACGASAEQSILNVLAKAGAELNASDDVSARSDARSAVEGASYCAAIIPNPCYGSSAPCDDRASVANSGVQLMGAEIERVAAARLHDRFQDELRNEIETVITLCSSPNLTDQEKPYDILRPIMVSSMQLYQKLYRSPEYRNLVDYDTVKACGAKLGVDF